ncbi:MAG: response regulator [Elusimicrobia bacterium]|nr:response regulator [Elusimicrobiota bacterium]
MKTAQGRNEPRCILIIEDREDVLGLLTMIATLEGWAVAGVKNGQDAFKAFSPSRFALALVDVNLCDGIDGIAVAQRLLLEDSALRVVMMSGKPGDEDRASRAGLGAFLAKPFAPTRIIELLQRRV